MPLLLTNGLTTKAIADTMRFLNVGYERSEPYVVCWRGKPAIGNQAMLELPLKERLALWQEEKRWQGHRYGLQSLAPRVEPILIFQKPWSGTQRDNVVLTGAGCMHVDGCRIGMGEDRTHGGKSGNTAIWSEEGDMSRLERPTGGRWPSNFGLVHSPECVWTGKKKVKNPHGSVSGNEPSHTGDENTVCYGEYGRVGFARYGDDDGLETIDDWDCVPDCPARRLGEMSGESRSSDKPRIRGSNGTELGQGSGWNKHNNYATSSTQYGDVGTAARYFPQFDWRYEIAERLALVEPVRYVPKVGNAEREAGLNEMALKTRNRVNPGGLENEPRFAPVQRHNHHPTMKPISLLKWMATLFLPPEGFTRRVVVPFAGVASEMIGCLLAGWDEMVGIEMSQEYCDIGQQRLAWWEQQAAWGLRDVDAILAVSRVAPSGEDVKQLELF